MKINNLYPKVDIWENANHLFFGKIVVFTGEMESMSRTVAKKIIEDIGGITKESLNNDTDYLVFGVLGYTSRANVPADKIPTKIKKADKMIEKGLDLKVLFENEFKEMIQFDSLSEKYTWYDAPFGSVVIDGELDKLVRVIEPPKLKNQE